VGWAPGGALSLAVTSEPGRSWALRMRSYRCKRRVCQLDRFLTQAAWQRRDDASFSSNGAMPGTSIARARRRLWAAQEDLRKQLPAVALFLAYR